MSTRDDKKVELPEPMASAYRKCMRSASRSNWVVYPGKAEDDEDWVNLYTSAQLKSYAAARVADATAELRTKLAESEASDAESMAMYRSARARADELQRRVAELEEVVEAVAAMNEEHPLFLGSDLSKEEINEIGGDAAHVTDTALILRKILSDRERGKT